MSDIFLQEGGIQSKLYAATVILEKKKNKYSWGSSLGLGQSIING